MNIYEKLLYIQQNLKAPKNQYNKFGDYNYRSCEDIQEALKPLLQEVKAVLLLNDKLELVGERYYILASAILQDTETGESIVNTAYARETSDKAKMDAAQITGSCSSYARKYALNGLFCIDDSKDPDTMDNSNNKAKGQQSYANNRVNANHIASLRAELERTGVKEGQVCNKYQLLNLSDMTMEQYKDAMNIFSNMPTKTPRAAAQPEQMTMNLY